MTYETPTIVVAAASTATIAGQAKTSSCTEAHGSTAFSTSSYEVDE